MGNAKFFKSLFRGTATAVTLFVLGSSLGCNKPQLLASEPSALDLDTTAPSCPGLTSVTVTSGPSLSLVWAQGTDELSQSSSITYSIYMRSSTGSYDLVSPAKIVIGAATTIISNGIQLGGTYYLFVTCKDEAGNVFPTGPTNEMNVTVNDATAPSTISDLDVTNENYTSVLLTWSPADDGPGGTTSSQMKYKLYSSTTSPVATTGSPIVTLTGTSSYTHTALTPGTTYYYKVVAEDIAGNRSTASNEANGATLTDSTVPSLTPSIVLGTITTTSLQFSWTAGADNVSTAPELKYNVYRCSGSTTCDPYAQPVVAQTAAGAVTYTHTGLSANTIYVVGVRAVDSSGNVSTNIDKAVTSTTYNSTGTFNFYPTTQEMGIRFGQGIAVANVVGTATGGTAYPDLIVGAPNASEAGSTYANTGCVYIFAGTGTGTFSTTPTQTVCQPSASANGANNRNFGQAIATADFDVSSTADLVVSSPQQNRIFILRSTNTSGTLSIGTSPTTIVAAGGAATTTFGWGLCVGDMDSSGGTDILVVNPTENCATGCSGRTGTGNVMIYSNISTVGNYLAPTYQTSISPTNHLMGAPNSFTIANNEQVARSCAVGKFDPSNATQDIVVVGSGSIEHDADPATQNDGAVSFFRKVSANSLTYQNTLLALTNNPPGLRDSQWGDGLAAVQVDGSNAPELFVGAPNDSSAGAAAGAVYGYSVTTSASNFVLTDLGNYYYGGSDQANNAAGFAIAAGDIWGHGDGKQDLVVGSPFDDRSQIVSATNLEFGDVFTYRNSSGVIGPAIQQKEFDVSAVNARISNEFGRSMCRGDVNNDGREDIVVGAPGQAYDPNALVYSAAQGAVYVYYGIASGEIDFANPSKVIFSPGNQGSGYFGHSCAIMDYNGDLKFDLLVGSPWRDVGANADRGAIFVYYGATNSDLPTVNSATLNSPLLLPNIYFGFSMTVGDFDGNGKKDLAVGSPYFDTGAQDTGGAWVFWANTSTGAIMPSTSVTTIYPPFGASGSTYNPTLANAMPNGNAGSITAASRTTNVVTVTTTAAHGLTAGRTVYIVGASPFDGYYTVASAPTGTTFTYALTGANGSATLSSPTFRSYAANAQMRFGWTTQAFTTVTGSAGVDLVVCAPWYDTASGDIDAGVGALTDIGYCFIYEGKVNGGLGADYQIMTTPKNDIRYPFGSTAYSANSLIFGSGATVGDWDNDGFDDLIICAYRMRNIDIAVNNTGGCFAYRGRSAGGIETATGYRPNSTSTRFSPLPDDYYYSTNQEAGLADFGQGVLVTDVNNNARDDLMVGQPISDNFGGPSNLGYNSGNVFVIRGGY